MIAGLLKTALFAVAIAGTAPALAAPPSASGPSLPASVFETATPKTRQALDRTFRELTANNHFSGVVLIAKKDQIVFQGAYGLASREYDVPNRMDTQFNLASAGKMFTAVSIGQLVDSGAISYSDPIGKYLDESWVSAENGKKITIAHLLSHTSGLDSYFNDDFLKASRTIYREIADYKPLVFQSKLRFEPGTDFYYSNSGYLLLGVIIEKVTGKSYFDYIRDNVFVPAGMTRSGALDLELVNKNYAQGYFKDRKGPPPPPPPPGKKGVSYIVRTAEQGAAELELDKTGFTLKNNIFTHVVKGGPAGGTVSTAPDMLKFLNAVASGKLVKPATLKLLTIQREDAPPGARSLFGGYGMMLPEGGFGHAGGFPGIETAAFAFPDGYRVIVLGNLDGAMPVAFDVLAKLAKNRLPN